MNDWEGRLDRELKALPGLKAPASFSPRVLAAVAKKQRHWRTWALGRQATLVGGVLAAAGGVLRAAQEVLGILGPRLQASLNSVFHAQRLAVLALDAAGTVWWSQRLPLAAAMGMMYLMCVALGTLLYKVAARPQFTTA